LFDNTTSNGVSENMLKRVAFETNWNWNPWT